MKSVQSAACVCSEASPHPVCTHMCEIVVVHGSASLRQCLGVLVGGAGEEVIAHGASNLLLVLIAWVALPAGVL